MRNGRPPASSIATLPTTCWNVRVRWLRSLPRKLRVHPRIVVNLFLKPVMNARWTNSHISHPRNPATRIPLKLTTARKRETIAMLPRSR